MLLCCKSEHAVWVKRQTFHILWRLYIENLFAQEVLGFPATQNCTKAGAYAVTVWKHCSRVKLNRTEISTGSEIKTLELNTALRRHIETLTACWPLAK